MAPFRILGDHAFLDNLFSILGEERPQGYFALDWLQDYRATLGHSNGCDLLGIEFLARPGHEFVDRA